MPARTCPLGTGESAWLSAAVPGLTAQFTHRLGGPTRRTVAEALADTPSGHHSTIGAYVASGESALHLMAVIVLVTGALVVAEMGRADRRERRVSSTR